MNQIKREKPFNCKSESSQEPKLSTVDYGQGSQVGMNVNKY